MPGFTAPKLLWVRKHEPEVFDRIGTVLLPKAYLRYRLTGEMIEEMSDAAGTLWLDVGARAWSEAALAATGLSLGQMPRLVEGSDPAGRLTDALSRRWGLTAAPVLAGGAGDNAAGAVEHRAFSGQRRIASGPTPRRRCMPSATPCPGSGIRWALPCLPPPASPGGAG
jgi:xylulokinase